MKRSLVFLSIIFIIVIQLSAGTDDPFKRIDIFHTDLHINTATDTASLHGEVHYSAVANQQLTDETSLAMHYYRLQIDSVAVNGETADAAFVLIPDAEFFEIVIPGTMTIPAGDTLTVSVWYTWLDQNHPDADESVRQGYYFFKQGDARWNQTAPETIGYTMSQPRDARAWFPAIDKPWNKSTLTMHITVDDDVPVIANGELVKRIYHDDGSVTNIFDHPYPVAPYLFAFNTGPFNGYDTEYTLQDGSDIPVTSYLFESDAAWADSANSMMKNMLGVFEELFGPYPFDRYGMIAIQPFRYGGMEHQTISTMRRNLFRSERITAHELAHQWWGNLVTCETWENIWLNEGFATYAEALYIEAMYGEDARDVAMRTNAELYFFDDSRNRYSLYSPPEDRLFGTTIYRKGAWVLHMLRNLIGDETFFSALRKYGQKHAYSVAGTPDLQAVFVEAADMELDWFFDQWVYEAGFPRYMVSGTIPDENEEDKHNITIKLKQIQEDAPAVFKGPVEFLVRMDEHDSLFTFWNDRREQEFLLTVDNEPDTILFDPHNKILKRVDGVLYTDDEDAAIPQDIVLQQNYPNPFNVSTVIVFAVPDRLHVRLRVVDTLGRKVGTIFDDIVEAGSHTVTFDASGVASGVYFAVMEANGRSKVRKMTYVR